MLIALNPAQSQIGVVMHAQYSSVKHKACTMKQSSRFRFLENMYNQTQFIFIFPHLAEVPRSSHPSHQSSDNHLFLVLSQASSFNENLNIKFLTSRLLVSTKLCLCLFIGFFKFFALF